MTTTRILGLVAAAALAIALAVPALGSTPGERVTTIQLTFDIATAAETFVGSGPGICRSGTADQQSISFIQVDEDFSIRMTKRLVCDDGSGTLDIFLSAGEPLGSPTRSGGWAITGGTGEYAEAVGGGTLTAKPRQPDTSGVDTMTGTITK